MLYSEVVERIVQGVLRAKPDASRARLLMQIDAAFPQVNNQVSQEYAAEEESRKVLRKDVALVFVGGSTGIPSNVLLKYLRDSTLVLSAGVVASMVEPYADFLRVRDGRLAYWAYSNLLISARDLASNGGGSYSGAATLTCIASPDIPALATDPFTAPDDYVPDLIDALIKFLVGNSASQSAQEVVN